MMIAMHAHIGGAPLSIERVYGHRQFVDWIARNWPAEQQINPRRRADRRANTFIFVRAPSISLSVYDEVDDEWWPVEPVRVVGIWPVMTFRTFFEHEAREALAGAHATLARRAEFRAMLRSAMDCTEDAIAGMRP